MTNAIKRFWTGFSLSNLLDYFIPAEMQVDMEKHRRARMFMLSHVFGPILGNTLPMYLAVMNISRDYRVVTFCVSITAFWIYPFILRWTGRYQLLAFLSVQNLIFCALWAIYAYGGLGSPFLPWILIFPLLAFLYLPSTGWVRNLLLVQIFGSCAAFFGGLVPHNRFPPIDLQQLQVIGMISMASVAIYFAMMSLYFAKMFYEQRSFTRELNAMISTSDNIRNLTAAADQASMAKADFVASMSHELRTPLNAIIGYSQILLEEAVDEDDKQSIADLKQVYDAGSSLLHLIDNILDYSRIEAGKMPVNPVVSEPANHVAGWLQATEAALEGTGYTIAVRRGAEKIPSMRTDWHALGALMRHVIAGVASHKSGGTIELRFAPHQNNALSISVTDVGAEGVVRPPVNIADTFDHRDDASATKYGGTGIEIALALRFAQLVGGSIAPGRLADGRPTNLIIVPDQAQPIVAPVAWAA